MCDDRHDRSAGGGGLMSTNCHGVPVVSCVINRSTLLHSVSCFVGSGGGMQLVK